MYAMNIQNDVIGLVLRDNCKSKQMTDIIADVTVGYLYCAKLQKPDVKHGILTVNDTPTY